MKMTLLLVAMIMGVGTAWADDTYQRITSTDDLEIDAEYIIVSEKNGVAMGTISNDKGQGISVTISNGEISLSSSSTVNVLTLGGSSNGYTLLGSQDGKYIGYPSGTKLAANESASTDNYKWTITFSGINASIANVATTTRLIRSYDSSKDFRGYTTSNGSDVQLYKKVNANATSVTIDASGISNTNLFDGTAAGSLSATVKDKDGQAISGATLTWTSETESVATIASDGTVTLVAVGTTKITASYAGVSGTYDASSANYTLTVTNVPRYTASFSVNGTVTTSAEYTEHETINFPADPTSINGFTFVGWCENVVTNGNKPTLVTSATMGTANKTFYAVFAIGSSSGSSDTYALVSDVDDLSDGDKVVIFSAGSYKSSGVDHYFSKANGSIADGKFTDVDVTVENNKFTSDDVVPMTLVKSGNNWKFMIGNNYVNAVSKGANLNNSGSENTITISDGNATVTATISSTNYNLQYNPNNGSGRFAYYSSSQKSISIYKQQGGITYSDYCTTVPTKISITVGASKFTSTYYSTLPLVVPDGLTAYTFKVNASNKLEISETIDEGETIAKDQAVIIYGNAGTYDFNITATDGTKDANNVLRGFDVASTTTGGDIYYRLTTKGNDPSTIGFYWGAENGEAFTVGAHKAYVAVDSELSFGAGARMADIFGFDEASGISGISNDELRITNGIYDLQGRRVSESGISNSELRKGLYIVNGKKMLVK